LLGQQVLRLRKTQALTKGETKMSRTFRKFFMPLTLVTLTIIALPQGRVLAKDSQFPTFARVTSLNDSEVQPTTPEEQEVWEKSMAALRSLEEFWSGAFEQHHMRFAPPRIQPDGRSLPYYDPNSNTIHLNLQFLVMERRKAATNLGTDGDMAYIVVLAHEYGHAVQAHLRLLDRNNRELQADLLAGIWVRYAGEKGLLDPGDPEEASNSLLRAGGGNHGSGPDRVSEFNRGYHGGTRAALRD